MTLDRLIRWSLLVCACRTVVTRVHYHGKVASDSAAVRVVVAAAAVVVDAVRVGHLRQSSVAKRRGHCVV